MGPELASLNPNARIDEWISDCATILDVDDPALLCNINTRDAYDTLLPNAFTPD